MTLYDHTWIMAAVALDRKRIASFDIWNGRVGSRTHRRYFQRCVAGHLPTGSYMIFTRDEGHHTSGWWKNPDYERCYHLSLSFFEPDRPEELRPHDRKLANEWVNLFYGADASKVWCEPPYSPEGRAKEVWHYRLFCSALWFPIIPRGEVYTREFTERGWKSFSEVQANLAAMEAT